MSLANWLDDKGELRAEMQHAWAFLRYLSQGWALSKELGDTITDLAEAGGGGGGGTEFIKENPEFQFGYARFEMTVTYSSRNVSWIGESWIQE